MLVICLGGADSALPGGCKDRGFFPPRAACLAFSADSRRAWRLHSPAGMERDDLEARTAAFAVAIFDLANAAREKPGGRRPADQLVDCATSVGANYRASARARSRDEFIAKLGVVNEEADEAVYWLQFLRSTKLVDEARVAELLDEAKQLRSIFAASCRTVKRNHRGKGRGRS